MFAFIFFALNFFFVFVVFHLYHFSFPLNFRLPSIALWCFFQNALAYIGSSIVLAHSLNLISFLDILPLQRDLAFIVWLTFLWCNLFIPISLVFFKRLFLARRLLYSESLGQGASRNSFNYQIMSILSLLFLIFLLVSRNDSLQIFQSAGSTAGYIARRQYGELIHSSQNLYIFSLIHLYSVFVLVVSIKTSPPILFRLTSFILFFLYLFNRISSFSFAPVLDLLVFVFFYYCLFPSFGTLRKASFDYRALNDFKISKQVLTLVVTSVFTFSALFMLFYFIKSSTDVYESISHLVARMFVGQIFGVAYAYDLFQYPDSFLGFSTIASPIMRLLGLPVNPDYGLVMMNSFNFNGVIDGSAGSFSSFYPADAYACFGILGVIFSPFIIAFLIVLYEFVFSRLRPGVVSSLIYSYFAISLPYSTSFNGLFYPFGIIVNCSLFLLLFKILSLRWSGSLAKHRCPN